MHNDKIAEVIGGVGIGCFCFAILFKLALLVGIVYVAIHFISKAW